MAATKTYPSSGTRPELTIPAMIFKNTKGDIYLYTQGWVFTVYGQPAPYKDKDILEDFLNIVEETHDAYMLSGSIQIFIIARFKI